MQMELKSYAREKYNDLNLNNAHCEKPSHSLTQGLDEWNYLLNTVDYLKENQILFKNLISLDIYLHKEFNSKDYYALNLVLKE
jgi:hypothetical protein